ncbi:MAG: LamG-like jellyroll fold domain-containing protein [Verrucomicrobiota bacterium]|jgi:hypothetical protein
MKTNKTILIASSSLLAAGMAQGAIRYVLVDQTVDPSSAGYWFDLNGDGTNDYEAFFDGSNVSNKPCIVGTNSVSGSYPGTFPNPTPYVLNELDTNPGYPANPGSNDSNGVPVIPTNTIIAAQFTVGTYPLSIGDPGGDQHGKNEGYLYQNGENDTVGQWPSSGDTVGYVGLAMVDNSVTPANTNYGWVHLDLDYTQPTAKLTVIDYAYQTIANSNIVAGDNGLTFPVIFLDPTNQTIVAGSTVTLNVLANGNPAPAYQWMMGAVGSGNYTIVPNAGNFSGANTPTLIISNIIPADQLDYVVVLTNSYGTTSSPPATLTVLGAGVTGPVPIQQVIYAGYPAQFNVTDLGGGATNRWQFNGANLANGGVYSGATTTNLLISSVNPVDVGNYLGIISTAYQSATSSVASLGIAYPDGSLYESAVRAYGAADYYRLGETSGTNAWDFIGGKAGSYEANASFGTNGPTAATGYPGFARTNYAAAFNSLDTNSFITLPPWNLNTNTVTITAWIYPQDNSQGNNQGNAGIVFSAGIGTNVYGIRYDGGYLNNTNGIYDGDIGYSWNDDYSDGSWDSGITAPQNEWSLVALAVSPTNAVLYIIDADYGVQSAVHTYPHPPATFNATEYIGTYPLEGPLGNNNFNGSIDEVAIFSSTLSSNQVYSLYESALGQDLVPPLLTIAPVAGSPLVRWTGGSLLQATSLLGPWTTNTAAESPYTVSPTSPAQFFRAKQ